MSDTPVVKKEDNDVASKTAAPVIPVSETSEVVIKTTENENDDNSQENGNDYLRTRKGDRLGNTAKRQRLLKKEQDTWVCFYSKSLRFLDNEVLTRTYF